MGIDEMAPSEFLAWLGACSLIGPILYFQIFGVPSEKHKYQKVLGVKGILLGNSSAVIPKKLLLYSFGAAFSLFAVAQALNHNGF